MLTVDEFDSILKEIDNSVVTKDVADFIIDLANQDNYIVSSFNNNLKIFNGLRVNTLIYLINLKLKLMIDDVTISEHYGYDKIESLKRKSPVLEVTEALIIHKLFNDQYLLSIIDDDINNFELIKKEYEEFSNIEFKVFEKAYSNGFSTSLISYDYNDIYKELLHEDYSESDAEILELILIEEYEDVINKHYVSEEVDESILKTKETITDLKNMIDMALDMNDEVWFNELSDRLKNLK